MSESQAELPPLEERPLVTFALFAYNQEKYIREAIEGAFAQTYEPLEIILSDDCSTDRTFEIMEKMAATYEGPHRLIVRRNPFNMGTALHVQLAFDASKGVLFVVAAGDDISDASRTAKLFFAWNQAKRPQGVVHSGRLSFIDGERRPIGRNAANNSSVQHKVLAGYSHSRWLPAAAPTCAYTREVFEYFGPLLGGSIIEDAPLLLRAALLGEFVFCEDPLVYQRLHDSHSGSGYTIDAPVRWNRFIQSKFIAFRNMQGDLRKFDGNLDPKLRRAIEKKILGVVRSSAGLFLKESGQVTLIEKIILAIKFIFAPAVGRTFLLRTAFSLTFFGFSFHRKLKALLASHLKTRPNKRSWV